VLPTGRTGSGARTERLDHMDREAVAHIFGDVGISSRCRLEERHRTVLRTAVAQLHLEPDVVLWSLDPNGERIGRTVDVLAPMANVFCST
jgi:hypothetical protein